MNLSSAFATTLSLGTIGLHFQAVHAHAHTHKASPLKEPGHPRRRKLDHVEPGDSISAYLNQQHEAGVSRPRFTLVGLVQDENATTGGIGRYLEEGNVTVYEIDLIEATPSVTNATIFSFPNGTSTSVGELGSNQYLLVSANQEDGDFAVLSVDASTDQIDGMAKKAGEELVSVNQLPGSTTVVATAELVSRDWACFVDSSSSVPNEERRLDGHHHGHQRHGHDHDHEHDHHNHDFLAQLKSDLGEHVNVNVGKRRALYPTDDFPQLWSYEVDFYIEIDQALVDRHGSELAATSYVNALVSAASTIFELEVDTHLSVAVIAVSPLYDYYTDAEDALYLMQNTYGDHTAWHDNSTGNGVDLHHALLRRDLGGGLAWVGKICSPYWGFGLSTGIRGDMSRIGTGSMYWDLFVFAHEVGHNFGAEHTHDSSRDPLVDTCGQELSHNNYNCPTGSSAAGSATIMSFCTRCGAASGAIGMTFGGNWFEDDRTNINNWRDNTNIDLSFHTTPKRVPKGMWDHVSSRGTCTSPNGIVPKVSCSTDSDCFDGISTTIDSCNANQCIHTISNNVCGNDVCELGESAEYLGEVSCSDCGPFSLESPLRLENTWVFHNPEFGIMFDVEAIGDVVIQGLDFFGTVDELSFNLYTSPGGYSGKETDSGAWTKVTYNIESAEETDAYFGTFFIRRYTHVSISFADISLSAGETQAFYFAFPGREGGIRIYTYRDSSIVDLPDAIDDHLKILNPAWSVYWDEFGEGPGYEATSWVGTLAYKLQEMTGTLSPSKSPTDSPTNNPTTAAPSKSPTDSPTAPPTIPPPTTSPTVPQPTKSPMALPTNSPTAAVTKAPSTSPTTKRPTKSPNSSPATPVITIGTFSFSDINTSSVDEEEFTTVLRETIEELGCPQDIEYRSCECTILSINGVAQRNRLRRLSRKLQSSLVAEYKLVIKAICGVSDCSDAQEVASQVYKQVTGDLLDAIQDGTIVSSLQETSSTLATFLQGATVSGDFSEVVVPILTLLSNWYPNWIGGSNVCLNDSDEPTYMKIYGDYYESSLDACCERYFSWDIYTCNGNSETAPIGFYPNWGESETKCLNSTQTASTIPDYVLQNPEQWLDNDIEACCEQHYNWAYSDCISFSGGSSPSTATGDWYVNHKDKICQRDCLEEGGGSCGGLAKPWKTLYKTPSSCCSEELSWKRSSLCEAQSNLTAVVGTSEWYVDWSVEKCAKDCDDSSDASCGGLAKRWDKLYGTSNDCCERIWYIERDECTVG